MPIAVVKERYAGKVGEVVLGAAAEQGGTRTSVITVGGDSALPFLHFEGQMPNPPVIAMEISDVFSGWNTQIAEQFGEAMKEPASWAKMCVEDFKADLIYLKLDGADPEGENRSAADCVRVVKDVLAAVGVPLIVEGCSDGTKNNEIINAVAEAAAAARQPGLYVGCPWIL